MRGREGKTGGMEGPRELELDEATVRKLVAAATERILAYIRALPEQPVVRSEGGLELARALKESLPEEGVPFDELLDLLFECAIPVGFNTASPGYLAYIPGGGIVHAAVADLIADATNRYVGVWLAAPGLVQLEQNVVAWFCEILGLPAGSGGFLTTGGSLANLSAVITARCVKLGEELSDGVVYTSEQAHHSVKKAALLAGLREANVRAVPTRACFRMRAMDVERLVAEDRARGLRPFLVVGSAGTTNTGAVDDLMGLSELCTREGLWFHVDAAYGGFFRLTERGREALRGIERADSITLDPHKGLFLPFGNGSLLVRDVGALRKAHGGSADYLPPMRDDDDLVDFCEISPELTRDFRGLRAWLPLKLHGVAPFRRALDEKLDLARYAFEQLKARDDIEIVAEPQLSVLAFRWLPARLRGAPVDDINAANRALLERVNARGHVYLTPTLLGGRFVIRIAVLHFRTHKERVDMALDDLARSIDELES